jgi:hypothetical protein
MAKERRRVVGVLLALAGLMAPAAASEVDPALARIRAVGREGAGNAAAADAWKEVRQRCPEELPAILAAMDGANPMASNWLRAAVDSIAERALAEGRSLPADRLEQFVKDSSHAPAGRRLAYEWLARVDVAAPGRLLGGLLHDPSTELRRDAVAAAMKEARSVGADKDKAAAIAAWRKALGGACDQDQVAAIVKALKTLGVEVDVAAHFGFIRTWQLISPFPNPQGRDFATVYPPEKGVDLAAIYTGKNAAYAKWQTFTTADSYGRVDLNKAIAKHKGVIAYAFAEVYSPQERSVEIRLGSVNAIKVFLNGKQVFARDEGHHGIDVDQYVGKGMLRQGRNEVLVKVCQNEQTEPWAQNWVFQVRLCDATGVAVPWTAAPGKDQPTQHEANPR